MNIIDTVERIEKIIYAALMAMIILVLIYAVVELALSVFEVILTVTPWRLESHELIAVLGAFLLVLIGVELLDTIKAYFRENTIHVEIVVLLAIIAVARKVILLDPVRTTTTLVDGNPVTTAVSMSGYEFGVEMMGIGVILLCLAAGYYLIKKAGITIGPGGIKKNGE